MAGKGALAAALELNEKIVSAAVDAIMAEAPAPIEDRPEKGGRGPAKSRLWAVVPTAPANA